MDWYCIILYFTKDSWYGTPTWSIRSLFYSSAFNKENLLRPAFKFIGLSMLLASMHLNSKVGNPSSHNHSQSNPNTATTISNIKMVRKVKDCPSGITSARIVLIWGKLSHYLENRKVLSTSQAGVPKDKMPRAEKVSQKQVAAQNLTSWFAGNSIVKV